MIFDTTGRVSPVLHVLGSAHVPAYLIEAPRPVIIDAGFSCLGPLYLKAIRETLGSRPPEILLLTHSHFDHCGAAAFLKKAFPGLKVAASGRAAEILARPRALEYDPQPLPRQPETAYLINLEARVKQAAGSLGLI